MTLRQILTENSDEFFVIKNKYCTRDGEYVIAGVARLIINHLTNTALQKTAKRIDEVIYID